MNLTVITNLALLCKLCASEEKFTLIGDYADEYLFKEGQLMLVTVNGLVNVHHKFNDIIKMNIISKNDD